MEEIVRLAMPRRRFIVGVLALGALTLVAVRRRPAILRVADNTVADSKVAATLAGPAAAAPAIAMRADENDSYVPRPVSVSLSNEPKVIRSADLRIQVRDVASAARGADDVAHARQGLLADSHVNLAEHAPGEARLVLRVPADGFDAALDGLRRLGTVRGENESAGDVTREYSDLETRLAVKEQTAGRLRDLLANRTGTLNDVLTVERELSRVVSELEQMKTQRRDYDRQIAMASIAVTFYTPGAEGLAALRVSLAESLSQVTDVLAGSISTVVYLVTFITPWVVLAVLGWWCVRAVRRAY
jgi:uncharacterized protein DUF4349